LIPEAPLIREILADHGGGLGTDFEPYFNHCQRVFRLCRTLAGEELPSAAIAIAAAFHDLGIWTAETFDYLEPSMALAEGYLAASGRAGWRRPIQAMIEQHHKITPYRGADSSWVEPFRRADWIDVSLGALRFGLPADHVAETRRAWPNAGFHRLLGRLTLRRLAGHPLSPLPMMKW
jgi:hypothetical protein